MQLPPYFHLINEGTEYDDGRYNRLNKRQEARQRERAVAVLKRMGYEVQLTSVA